MKSTDNNEVIELLRKHTREELVKIMEFTEENLNVPSLPSYTRIYADCVVPWAQ